MPEGRYRGDRHAARERMRAMNRPGRRPKERSSKGNVSLAAGKVTGRGFTVTVMGVPPDRFFCLIPAARSVSANTRKDGYAMKNDRMPCRFLWLFTDFRGIHSFTIKDFAPAGAGSLSPLTPAHNMLCPDPRFVCTAWHGSASDRPTSREAPVFNGHSGSPVVAAVPHAALRTQR